jgi:isopentenyl-diphosphate Delta-isomerase
MSNSYKDKSETIDIVNNNDKSIGNTTVQEAHQKGLLHREVYIYIVNQNKQVLLQKRSDNHLWDHSAAGHLAFGEDYLDAALRVTREQLGIILNRKDLLELGKVKLTTNKERRVNYRIVKIFLVLKSINLDQYELDPKEVEEIRYFTYNDIKELFKSPKTMTKSLKELVMKYIINKLKEKGRNLTN